MFSNFRRGLKNKICTCFRPSSVDLKVQIDGVENEKRVLPLMIAKCSQFGSKFTKCFLIPQRYIMGIMFSFATFSTYTMRVTLSVAITEMTPKPNITNNPKHEYCPVDSESYHNSTTMATEKYQWNESQQGIALSCFYWTYIISHLPGALLAEKVGGKHVLGFGLLINAIFTILTPPIMEITDGNLYVMYTLRMILGFAQGPIYPVVTGMVAQWIPPQDKSLMSSLAYSGGLLGAALTNLIGGRLIALAGHWNVIFYFYGGLGLIWNLAWQLVCYSFPKTHPCIKEKERLYLEQELRTDVSGEHIRTPLKAIMTSVPVWALIIGQFGHDWGWFIMVTDLPKYMSDVLRFDVQSNGLYSSLPYLFEWVSGIAAGYMADWLVKKDHMSLKNVRRIFGTLGQAFPGIFMLLASYGGCNKMAAVWLFVASLLFMGFFMPGMKVNAIDLSPNFAGSVMAIANGLGVFAGMAAPGLVGVIVKEASLTEWRTVFWIACAWLVGTNIIFLLFFSADVQKWNQSKEAEHEA